MFKVGFGCDQHRYIKGERILLGGIEIPAQVAIEAHSDGDTLIHAITDALLGAVAAGDIGELFPDNLEENRNRRSEDFLRKACEIVATQGYEIVNVDSTVQAQTPKLSEYKRDIAKNIADIIGIDPVCVSVKAKTAEGMDAIGRCEGIRVDSLVLVRRIGVGY